MPHDLDHLAEKLLALPKFGEGIGLHRMADLLSAVENQAWLRGLDAIKITGSNGKGSVCAMLAAIFGALGIPCGLYTSPHLLRFNERIVTDGQPISDDALADALAWFLAKQDAYAARHPGDTIGAFEAYTAMAMHHFSREQPQAVVAEAGIGGRFDATRPLSGTLAGLASLDREHTVLLGPSLELIAYDKADLCGENGTLVAGSIDGEILRRLSAYCRLRNVTLVSIDEAFTLHAVRFAGQGMRIDCELEGTRLDDLHVGLPGRHQASNAAVAMLLARRWLQRHAPGLSEAEQWAGMREGLRAVTCTGRFQQVYSDPDVFIDVAHTPDAVDALVRTVEQALAGRPILLVTGASVDKQAEAMVPRLLHAARGVVCTRAYHKGRPASEITALVRAARPDLPTYEAPAIEEAMAMARHLAARHGMTVLVAGGLFLAVEAWQALQGNDPGALRFF